MQHHDQLPILQLPTDFPSIGERAYQPLTHPFEIPSALAERFQDLSEQLAISVPHLMLAAFQVLLQRYSLAEEFLLGAVLPDSFDSSVLVLQCVHVPDQTFGQLAQQLQAQIGHGRTWAALKTKGAIQAAFVFGERGAELDQQECDLILQLDAGTSGTKGQLIYRGDLFLASTIMRMQRNFCVLLEGIADNPDQLTSRIRLVHREEEELILNGFNSKTSTYPTDTCYPHLFHRQAERTPDAVALQLQGRKMTYRELNRRANALARHLQSMGVRRDVYVGYFGKRTLDWVVAILAIWKAGGIYVPLDPAYPSERIGYMIADSGMKVLLTYSNLLEKMPAHQASVVLLDQAGDAWEQQDGMHDVVGDAGPDDIAYVIYTSGSTGRPKGAMVEHKGMINHLCAKVEELGMSELDQVAQNSSHCVDISIWQLFSVLLVGGCVQLLPDEIAFDTSRQVEAIEDLRLTIVETVPTLLRAMLDEIAHLPDKPTFAALRWMIPNGEALPPELCRRWLTAYPNVPLINAYGPTECSDDVTHEYIREVPGVEVLSMRIGKALPNVRLYVLDQHRSIVPVGVMGELYVGGIVVGRGYLNNPEKTEAAYYADWITEQPGARVYRTGDYVRYLEDGSLEFMGRVDHQVKIRGLRIELGDIEAALTQHPEIEHVIVVTKGEEHEKRLVAYMICARGANPTNLELHAFLAETLPAHMIPNAFVQLEEFPLTLNGKIDRKRLPDVIVEPEASEHYVEPITPEERLMTSLWSEMLGVGKVGLTDNFFDIGGHSLTAMHLIARVRREFSADVSLRTLFEAPTPAGLLVALRLAKEAAATPQDNRIVHVSRDQELAASFAQQRLWLVHQLEPNSSSYNLTFRFDLHGPLDRRLLQKALQAVVDRQEVFRTVFEEREGQPVPVILPTLSLEWQEEDLMTLADEGERARRMSEIIKQQAGQVYDLRQAPLFGTRLVRLTEEHHVLVLNMHHIVFDGWSVEVLINEMIGHYTAAPLPQLDVQYVDYAAWQRANLTGEAYDQQLRYWKKQLGGELPMLQVPSDQPRQPNREAVGNVRTTLLPNRLINQLQELSQESGATMFMIMLAAYKTLLYRYTDQTDLLVGVPAANRNSDELQGLIGFFVNMLVMRTDLTGDPSFADLVGKVKEVAMEAYANQDVPFDTLVEMLQPEREDGRTPIIQTVFSYETYKPELRAFRDTGLTMRVEEIRNQTSKFDLSFYMQEQEEGIKLEIEYDAVLFDTAMIDRMLENFSVLLEGIVRHPEQSISTLPLLTEREKQMLLQWTDTATQYPSEKSIPQLFEEQAARTPDAIAATFGGEQVTYRMLNERANRYAKLLCEHGVTLEQPVGIAVDRSIEMLVGIVAILKAGGAYVPLDTKYPADRLKFMMENAGIRVILAQRHKQAELPAHDATVLLLDEAVEDREDLDHPGLALPFQPSQMACVLYTSGSTGQPKGVRVTHQGIVRLVLGTDYMKFENETFLQFSPLSFDASTFEIWGSLLHGNRLVIMPPHMASLEELGEVVRREGVTAMWLTAGLFHQLADIPLDSFASVRHLLAGGEALLPAPTYRIQQKLPGCRIIHIYGPTENSSFSTHYLVPWTEEVPSHLPIGRAVANSTTYVLDGHQQLVPIGVQGELYVGGDGIALGYLNRPDLTEASFIPDAFSDKPGARLYRTGDLARYNSSGELICLGRADRQLKIRGFRIELGEVDAVCRQHPSVRHTLTLAHEDKNGTKRIVVYVVPNGPLDGLDQHVRAHLPYFMIPSAYMTVDELPLTANGKVDQRRLPPPVFQQTSDHHVAPRTELERNVAAAWEEVLDLKQVGVHDDFFDLGGHSLLATRMISRLRSRLGVEVPLRALFAAPTLEGFTEHVARCMQDVQALQVPSIRPLEPGDRKPLSFAQQRLWFLNEWMPESSLYNVPFFYWLNGRLDVEALKRSLQEIADRHDVLRSSIGMVDGELVQVVSERGTADIPCMDLGNLPAELRKEEALRFAQAEADRPFDLLMGPLFRAQLFRLDDEEHLLVVNFHHIISDGASIEVFENELAALYAAFTEGEPTPLGELSIQYADYAYWQRQQLQGELMEQQEAYWRGQLAGELPLLQLPTDRLRPEMLTYNGNTAQLTLPTELVEDLQQLAKREDSTMFMLLLAAWKTLLHRYSGQEDLLIGIPVSNRTRSELEPLIGFFVNTLVIRTDFSASANFLALLQQVRQTVLEAYDNQDIPFDHLVEILQPDRDTSRSPLFQVMFSYEGTAPKQASLAATGLEMERLEPEIRTSKFDLSLFMKESGPRGLEAVVEYNTDLFDRITMERMLANLHTLLRGIADNPARTVNDLPILSEQERQIMLVDWNQTASDYPSESSIQQLFEQQAARTPDAIAATFGEEQVTYRMLDVRANRYARLLCEHGVTLEQPVGIAVDRSIEMLVGILAILKAGGAYVPLDTKYPADRLKFMMENAGIRVILAQRHKQAELPAHEATVILLDEVVNDREDHNNSGLALPFQPSQMACVLYTSGSTGQPKGVRVTHQGIVRLVLGTDYMKFENETFLQFSPLSFDASTFEIWGSLLHGNRLVIMPPHMASLEELGEVVRREGVTAMWLTAGLFHQLADIPLDSFASVRHLLAGGEALLPAPTHRIQQKLPGCRIIHMYGPTENTTFSTHYLIPRTEEVSSHLPIGRAVANSTTYVLDGHQQLVPIGVQGELYVGGDGVALGYLNRPDLTEASFIPDPFSDKPGARLYRTGDLARYNSAGELICLGRVDRQLKIRGFRIEFGEVDAVCRQHPSVRHTLTVAHEDKNGTKRIVVYVVSNGPIDGLEQHVRAHLPYFMIPSAYMTVDELPLTANGKVDQRRLPPPVYQQASNHHVAPRTELEQNVAEAWEEVLDLHGIGVHDDFFDLGGHSLLATRMISRLRSRLGVEVPLQALFAAPTLEGFTEHVARSMQDVQTLQVLSIRPLKPGERKPLSFAQQRLWFMNEWMPESSLYNVPFFYWLNGRLDAEALARSLQEIVDRHDVLRSSIGMADGELVQMVGERGTADIRFIDLSDLPTESRKDEALRFAQAEADRPFDLRNGPLFRVQLIRLDDEEHLLVVNFHHIISDGASIEVFENELAALYAAFAQGEPSPLGELSIQYADYAHWQRQQLQGELMEQQEAYWRGQLAGELPLLQLPTDRPRPEIITYHGNTVQLTLPAGLVEELQQLAKREDSTMFMLLLGAWKTLFYRYSGQEDILIGIPVSNRTRSELEPLIGFFVNTLVIRTDFSASANFLALLQQVRQTVLEAYDNQDIPFDHLVDILLPDRDISRSPMFQVMFSYEGTAPKQASLAAVGLEMERSDSEIHTSKFDLSLSMKETGPQGLEAILEYNTDLFDRITMERMLANLHTLLREIADDPARLVRDLPILSEGERQIVLVDWNQTESDYPNESSIQQLFEQHAERSPDAVAVVFGEKRMTYRELNEQANRLAHHLLATGLQPGQPVGIAMDRSLEMLVGVLGILKAGGAYVPLDSSYPVERLAFMIRDTKTEILLTQMEKRNALAIDGLTVICLDGEWDEGVASTANPEVAFSRDQLAYIMYTSGSTGMPKGVCVPHHAVVRLVKGTDFVTFGAEEVFLQSAPTAFDAATFEIWGSLLNGGRLVFMPPGAFTMEELTDMVKREGVTTVWMTTALFHQLAETPLENMQGVRQLLTGGELMSIAHAEKVRQSLPNCRILNMYGPTENTTFSTFYPMPSADRMPKLMPIGRPIANTTLYVLDPQQEPVPIGVAGELYVGGEGLALGYLNRPDLTAEKFVDHPFLPNARLYRTGDIVRYLSNGDLEFLGRVDHQVKIRGYRIELGEIEAACQSHPAVRQAFAIAHEEQPGVKHVVVYLLPHEGSEDATVAELREFVQERLPHFMVPSAFIWVDDLPLNPNGKVDRKSLPAPSFQSHVVEYVAPRDAVEELIAEIFAETLNVEKVGVYDNFYDLGGQSFLAIRIMSRLQAHLQMSLSLRILFEAPTVAGIAKRVTQMLMEEMDLLTDEEAEQMLK